MTGSVGRWITGIGDPIKLTLCGDQGDCSLQTLQPGENDTMAAEGVSGSIELPDGSQVDFDTQNPFTGEPYIELQSRDGSNESQALALSDGEVRQVILNSDSFVVKRESDTDAYKMMTLAVG